MKRLLLFIGLLGSYLIYVLSSCSTETQEKLTGSEVSNPTYKGDEACRSCHLKEFSDWKKSDHFMAMLPASDSTVLGDFNNREFTADGVSSRMFRKEGDFYIHTQGSDGKQHDFKVLYTFGYYPLQQYLVAFPGGRMQATRLSWNTEKKIWFHQYGGQQLSHHDWLHWTGNGQNWNTMCAGCHSTGLKKNYDAANDTYHTSWKVINVSCESCHGPGSKHMELVQSADYKMGNSRIKNAGLIYTNDSNSVLQVNTCVPCHARKSDIAQTVTPSDELMDNFIPQIIDREFYFADGQIKDEDYEYGSFAQSKMFSKNVRCSNCHNPHSGKLKFSGNAMCTSCHNPALDAPSHHFHKPESAGAQCINCHMPERTYMGADLRRDHSFRIPRPDQSVKYGTPNTCNSCHKDKTSLWAMNEIIKRFGPERKYHFSDDLLPGSLLNDKSEPPLIKLLGDKSQPEIARATAAFYLSNLPSEKSLKALLEATSDEKAQVRYQAVRALEYFPPQYWSSSASALLKDKVRAVRIAAADLYHRVPSAPIPDADRSHYQTANQENKTFLEYQRDFSVGNILLADYYLQEGDQVNAIRNYLDGLRKDSLMNYARLNLSAAYNATGKNDLALKSLQDALLIDPDNDRIYYNLGLLQYELKDIPAALHSFQKAMQLKSVNPSLYFNYGLLLQQEGRLVEAEKVFLNGIKISPRAEKLNYALAFYYLKINQQAKAKPYIKTLKELAPANPEYQQIFRQYGV